MTVDYRSMSNYILAIDIYFTYKSGPQRLDGVRVEFVASVEINPRDTLFQLRPLSRPLAAAASSAGARQPLE